MPLTEWSGLVPQFSSNRGILTGARSAGRGIGEGWQPVDFGPRDCQAGAKLVKEADFEFEVGLIEAQHDIARDAAICARHSA